jgi:hypothetical protein
LVLARRMLVQVVSVALHLKIKHPTSQDWLQFDQQNPLEQEWNTNQVWLQYVQGFHKEHPKAHLPKDRNSNLDYYLSNQVELNSITSYTYNLLMVHLNLGMQGGNQQSNELNCSVFNARRKSGLKPMKPGLKHLTS